MKILSTPENHHTFPLAIITSKSTFANCWAWNVVTPVPSPGNETRSISNLPVRLAVSTLPIPKHFIATTHVISFHHVKKDGPGSLGIWLWGGKKFLTFVLMSSIWVIHSERHAPFRWITGKEWEIHRKRIGNQWKHDSYKELTWTNYSAYTQQIKRLHFFRNAYLRNVPASFWAFMPFFQARVAVLQLR